MNYLKKKIGNIKIVAFDFDNTLVDERKLLIQKWKIILNDFLFINKNLKKTFFEFYQPDNNKKILDKTLSKLKIDNKIKYQILNKFRKLKIKEFQIPKTHKLVKLLISNKIKVGIMTNGIKDYQITRIKQLSFYKYLNFFYFGDKFKKPNKKFFLQSKEFKSLKDPSNFLYIGNDYKNDIVPAKKLKMVVCLVNSPIMKKSCNFKSIDKLYNYLKKVL